MDIWSLGVVLYICLCGFPPFSDELYSAQHPYTLAQQIRMGRFDYPSPYWDSVGDAALDLIDRMLTVNVNERISVDGCLQHPWITGEYRSISDSTEGLSGALGQLDFSSRKIKRERTLISKVNDARLGRRRREDGSAGKRSHHQRARVQEATPAENQKADEFAHHGVTGDPILYEESRGR